MDVLPIFILMDIKSVKNQQKNNQNVCEPAKAS